MKPVGWTLLILFVWTATAQQPPQAAIEGIVLQAGNNGALSKTTVELFNFVATGTSGAVPSLAATRSDGTGKFFFPNIPAGSYRLTAAREGFIRAETTFQIASGQRRSDISIALEQGGSISGRIIDRGKPPGLSDVVLFRARLIEGQLDLTPVLSSKTNDLGEYHIFWAPSGRYYLGVIVWDTAAAARYPIYVNGEGVETSPIVAQRNVLRAVFNRALGSGVSEDEGHAFTYYPATAELNAATVIEIRPGESLRGIDITSNPLPARHIRGRISGLTPDSNPAANRGALTVTPIVGSFDGNAMPPVTVNPDGTFDAKVLAGNYALHARGPGGIAGRAIVDVRDRDASGVTIDLVPGYEVSGRIIVERAASAVAVSEPAPVPAGLSITLRYDPLLPGAPSFTSRVSPDGTFTIAPLSATAAARPAGPSAGDYRVLVEPILRPPSSSRLSPPIPPNLRNAYVKSIRTGETDLLNGVLRLQGPPREPIVIVIGTNPGVLEGRVVNERQLPVANATLALVPENNIRYKSDHLFTKTDSDGRFRFDIVPPGAFQAFAWERIETGTWQDSVAMRKYEARGKHIEIQEGSKTILDLTAIPPTN